MTTGTSTNNQLTTWQSPEFPGRSCRVGSHSSKSWSGADYSSSLPKPQRRTALRYVPPKYGWRFDESQQRRVRYLIREGELVEREFWDKPPKRAKYSEQHAYQAQGYRVHNATVLAVNDGSVSAPHWVLEDLGNQVSQAQPELWVSNDDIALLGKLREAIAGSDFNAGVALGESPRALAMITNSATRIYRAYREARRGRLSVAAEILTRGTDRKPPRRAAASNWLELQYGWLPLLKDAKGGAEFLAHNFSVPIQWKVHADRNAGGRKPYSWNQGSVLNGANYVYSQQRCRASKRITAILTERDVIALSGLTDPLSVAWELVPYSFVMDWFIPIGNYLAARGLAQSVTGTFVTSFKRNTVYSSVAQSFYPFHSSYTGAGTRHEKWSFSRSISTTLEVPLPQMKGLNKIASWQHAVNAVALLTNRRG